MWFLLRMAAIMTLIFYVMGEAPTLSWENLGTLVQDKAEKLEKAALTQAAEKLGAMAPQIVSHTLNADDLAAPFMGAAPQRSAVAFKAPLPKPRPL